MFKENFHTHTKYCDGKNTAEEMIQKALELNFNAIGFSGHAYLDFDCGWAMSKENTAKYIEEIKKIKEKYRDKITVRLGTELDYYSSFDKNEYEYTIGSVHYIKCEEEYCPVDSSADLQLDAAKRYFGGSVYGYAAKYFETVADVLNKTDADFIGHFDLVSKFNEGNKLFDSSDKRYTDAWTDAVDALLPYGKPFEINTGAMARQLRSFPYPSLDMAEYINSKGGYFIVTSDCHYANKLDYYFEETYRIFSKYDIVSFDEIIRKNLS